MRKLFLYSSSVRYLKLVQVLGRLSAIFRRRVLYRFDLFTARYLRRATGREQIVPIAFSGEARYPGDVHDLRKGTFTFLNRCACLGQPVNWFPQSESKLWIYNLHYFDYAVSLGWDYAQGGDKHPYRVFRRLVREWISNCPIATPLAWDPYPLSLRIKNWIKAYTFFEPVLIEDVSFATELRRSLYAQASFLEDNLEFHLLGNHLIENGRALLFAGLFFADRVAERWQRKGERILWRELHEQFLDDGGHCERSPMYHQMMVELYQEVISVLDVQGYTVPEDVIERVEAMQEWSCAVLHPDGEIPLLNDAVLGVAPVPVEPPKGAPTAPAGLKALSDSGYFVFRDDSARDFVIFDCGPLGPDHQPGHGHCDMLSYELSLSGQRLIVDSGVGNYYGELDWRTYYRSTRAHNTVVVDGSEQSEIWDRFRVARRARALGVRWADRGPELAYTIGAHSGYCRLKGNPVHHRWMCWVDRSFWLVCDQVIGEGWHQVDSLVHFHPQAHVVSVPKIAELGQVGEVRRGGVNLKVVPWGVQSVYAYCGETDPIQGWYAPEFGTRVKNHVWSFSWVGKLPVWLGYVLWPEPTDVTVQVSTFSERSCCIDVRSGEMLYHIVCSPADVNVEKERVIYEN
jgi:hypothetical protein